MGWAVPSTLSELGPSAALENRTRWFSLKRVDLHWNNDCDSFESSPSHRNTRALILGSDQPRFVSLILQGCSGSSGLI